MPEKCKYKHEYMDLDSGETKLYVCEEDAVKDGFCIFHHPEYWREHKDEVRKRFMEKVEDAINNKKSLFCIGYNLPEINLFNKKFEAPVYFTKAIFHEGANFFGAEFSSEAKFSDVTFASEADFSNVTFSSEAEFRGVTFSSEADFSNVTFSSEAYFSGATFSSEADFFKATFSSRANFSGAKFSEADFSGALFSGVNFIGATFSGAVEFDEVKFLGKVLFNHTTFLDAVSFVHSDFSPDVLEKSLDPYNRISFKHANFERQERVVFDGCNMERVSFICTDLGRVKFRNVKWKNFKIYDEKLFLLKESKQERENFLKDGKRKLNEILDKISKVQIEKISEVLEEKRKADETEEEIKKVVELRIPELKEIIGINWLINRLESKKERSEREEARLSELLKERENISDKIKDQIDEIKREVEEAMGKSDKEIEEIIVHVIEKDEDLTLDNVLAVYRALRENYDYYLRYDESGKFFVNEMRLKKRFSNPVEKIIMSAYELLCLYGESYTRTIFWILATISLFALARLYMNAPIDSLDSLKISTAAFFQLYYNSDLLTFTERLISIPILGSLYISLKRKLERRIRH
jgi:uncharacterized protein YjbI with pentapeptide repeats